MSDWSCTSCSFETNKFKDVWDHSKGASHVMEMMTEGTIGDRYINKKNDDEL